MSDEFLMEIAEKRMREKDERIKSLEGALALFNFMGEPSATCSYHVEDSQRYSDADTIMLPIPVCAMRHARKVLSAGTD
jgi:hypothetical protein